MKQINRRDYLKAMGATTAGAIAGTELHVFAQGTQRPPTKKDTSKIFVQSGPRRFDLLSSADVKLVFHGLMGIWRNADEHAEVGFHCRENGKHKHVLKVMAFRKNNAGQCTQVSDPDPEKSTVRRGEPLQMEINRPAVLDGVYFFQPPLSAGRLHDNDFRWVQDVEGPNWYDAPNLRKTSFHDPVLKVRNGLFYTLSKTSSTFRHQKVNGDDALYLGNIAEYVGTNIYLEPGGGVSITLPRQTISLPQAANTTYEVHFMNACLKNNGTACQPKPYHPDKTERGDFYMHFESINLPANRELELVIAQGIQGSGPTLCGQSKLSDESPCSAIGFGGPQGFPVFP